jgi:hypothetical protein
MSPRPLPLALLTLVLAGGCGEDISPGAGRFGVDFLVSKALADQLSSFQIAVLPEGSKRDCTEIQNQCLRQQVNTRELLVLRDANGNERRALRFSASLSGTGTTSQDVIIEVPVGRDYALVIEGLSSDSPPRFLGSSCTYMPDGVSATQNKQVIAAPMTLTSVDCDPTI